MRSDTIIIGGGLSSLVCGIKLQKAGQRCLIVSAGQNALHFSSGAFGLLGKLPDGTAVKEPMRSLSFLPEEHPYSKIGVDKMAGYVSETPAFFESCGVRLHSAPIAGEGGFPANGYRLTPLGSLKPAWLAMEDVTLLQSKDNIPWSKALIVNFFGFLDFNSGFIAEGLSRRGVDCRVETVSIGDVENLRKNPTEMRSVGIARVMGKENNWKEFGSKVRKLSAGEDLVILPEVFGLGDPVIIQWLREMIPAEVMFVGTMPPSVPGIRTQMRLKKAFEVAGGTFLSGDTAVNPTVEDGYVTSIHTTNLGSISLDADNYVLASGHLFGKGLESTPSKVVEPVFGLDTDFPSDRKTWCDEDFFARQAYDGYGVVCDGSFRPFIGGKSVRNLFVIGSEVGGCDSLYEGSGAGVAIMTAMSVAGNILSGK
ncbi:MAG: anaerobic glycerol-3-phosphate dehydrogenase subunit B [Bacteroidales bacterium]|nr:anaerobic glycerol-3-phosphate dehydrogenase subunit B [Bacteroidales bacterium]